MKAFLFKFRGRTFNYFVNKFVYIRDKNCTAEKKTNQLIIFLFCFGEQINRL